MNTRTKIGFLVLGTFLSACASRHGDAAKIAPPAKSYANPSGGSSQRSYGQASPSPEAPASPPSDYSASAESESSADERPGLGPSWGESIDSNVTHTSFERQDRSSPSATASFFYNDEDGVKAVSRGRYVDWRDSVTAIGRGAVRVSLVDSGGSPLRAADVDGRLIALGSEGDRYVIRIENNSPQRLEAVATVDGLDVLDGNEGDIKKRGYVISPHHTLEIEGFRESSGSVRAFRFGKTDDSYASLRGKGRNVGVVGVAIFREEGSYGFAYTEEELNRRETADPFPNSYAPPPVPVSRRRGW
jgi:hypothetical protein